MIVSSGQITITDLGDSKQLVSYVGSSSSKIVIYNPSTDEYIPNYSINNQVLTPQLFIAGAPMNIIDQAKSITWYKQNNSGGQLIEITNTDSDYALGSKNKTLTIKKNVLESFTSMAYICEIVFTDLDTGFDIPIKSDIEIVKVANGIKGDDGVAGRNAVIGVLTNESHIVPTDPNGNFGNFTGASTTMLIYNGMSDDSSNWAVTISSSVGVTGVLSDRTYTVTGMNSDTGYVDLTAKRSGYSDITKRFVITKNKQGVDGETPTVYWLVVDATVIQKDAEGNLLPETINITAKSQTGDEEPLNYSGRFRIWERLNGSWGNPVYTSASNEHSVEFTPSVSIKAVKIELFTTGGLTNMLDEEVVVVVSDGKQGLNALTPTLSNDISTIGTDEFGDGGNYESASTTMSIYEGTTDVSNQWTVTASASTGVIGTLSGKTYQVTNMTVDSGYVDLTAKRTGYSDLTRRFSISKSKAGSGENATSYWLISDAPIIKRTNDIYTPPTIRLTGRSQTGISPPVSYACRFIIADSTDGVTFTDRYTSSSNETERVYTPRADIKSLRVRMYLAGSTTNLLDEEIIPIIEDGSKGEDGKDGLDGKDGEDGKDGLDSVLATVWTPDGNTLKNSEGTLKASVIVYKGSTEVSPSAFKWYERDPTAIVGSGGDIDSGNGWRRLTSSHNMGITGYDTATITIPSSAIAGVESFKCVVTYDGIKYQDVVTVIDVTDPITVSIIGTSTFKNGQGESQFLARLYRNGEEIDLTGSQYIYSWSLYFSDGTASIAFGVKKGKSITVKSSDFIERADLICEISKN